MRKSNVHDADFDEPREHDGFRARRVMFFRLADEVDYWDGEEPPPHGASR